MDRSGRLTFVNAYRTAVDPLQALGDTTRRAIVEGLRGRERTVGELAASLPVSRPAVSQHLAVLRAAGLVLDRPQGTRRWYRLDPIGLVRLQERLETLWGLDTEPGSGGRAEASAPEVPGPGRTEAMPEARAAGSAGTAGKPRAHVASAAEPSTRGERKKRKKKGGRK